MTTEAHMGRYQLKERLAAQVGSMEEAISILKKRGMLDAAGHWTAKGNARNAMTAEERAKDRAAKASGHDTKAYSYNAKTNRATLAKRKRRSRG